MKAIFFSLFLSVIFSNVIAGQNGFIKDPFDKYFRQEMPKVSVPENGSNYLNKDTIATDKYFRQQIPEFIPKGEYKVFTDQFPDTTYNPFPGSSRYYAQRPELVPSYSHFIVKPDTSSKYFLIIKNPLTNKISK
jgi:hypothetical protein